MSFATIVQKMNKNALVLCDPALGRTQLVKVFGELIAGALDTLAKLGRGEKSAAKSISISSNNLLAFLREPMRNKSTRRRMSTLKPA